MRNIIRAIKDAPYALAAFIAVNSTMATEAMAGQGISGKVTTWTQQVRSVAGFLLLGGALIGVVLIITGLLKLKQASESNGQIKYSDGLWRLGIGSALLVAWPLSGTMTETLGFNSGSGGAAGGTPSVTLF
jgi:hypothetical protein